MDKQTIIISDNPVYATDVSLTESEQIWRFAGDYYSFFKRKKYLVFLFCFLGACIGLAYAFSKKTKYIAEVKFTSNVDNSNTGGYLGLAQQFGLISGGGSSSAFSGDNLMSLMKTPSMLSETLVTTVPIKERPVMLMNYYLQSKGIRQQWTTSKPALAAASFNPDLSKPDYLRDSVLKLLNNEILRKLTIDRKDKDLSFISVVMTDQDSVFAKVFIETLVKTVTDYYIGITTVKLRENVRVFQEKADSLSRNFGQRLSTIASTQDINVNPSRQSANVPIQRQQIGIQVDNAVYQEVVKNLELSKIQLQKETPFIQVIETPKYPLDEVRPSKLVYSVTGFLVGGGLIIFVLVISKELTRLLNKLKRYGTMSNA